MLLFVIALFSSTASAAALPPASWQPCCGPADTLCASWRTVSISPAAPQAGDTLFVNATGAMGVGAVLASPPLAAGAVAAFHNGADVFDASIATCGESSFSVLGMSTVIVNALACPTVNGGPAALSITFPLPSLAAGMGAFNVSINGTDNTGRLVAFCIDVLVSL